MNIDNQSFQQNLETIPMPSPISLSLVVMKDRLAVCKLPPLSPVPPWVGSGPFYSVTRTSQELSVVCLQEVVPEGVLAEKMFRALQVLGPLDFSLVGILASLTGILAQRKISLFAISTYDTDYLLVREEQLGQAILALRQAGYQITLAL